MTLSDRLPCYDWCIAGRRFHVVLIVQFLQLKCLQLDHVDYSFIDICSWDLIHDKSTLVEVIVWCRQAASHYLYQWWAVSMTPCGTTGSQCNLTKIPWHVFDAVPQNTSGSLRNLWKLNPGWSFLFLFTMTSSNGNIFRVTDPVCGEFIGPRWIPCTKASDADFWCFLWSTPK